MGFEVDPQPGVLTEVELNYSDESLGANAVWKATFLSSPQEPNVHNTRRQRAWNLRNSRNAATKQKKPPQILLSSNYRSRKTKAHAGALSSRGLHINLGFKETKALKAMCARELRGHLIHSGF